MFQNQTFKYITKNYILFCDDNAKTIDISGNLPDKFIYPIKQADESKKFVFESSELLVQNLIFEHYQVDNYQLNSKLPFKLSYTLPKRRIFVTFILDSDVDFSIENGTHFLKGTKNTHYMSAERKGKYNVHCKEGTTALALISVKPKWLVKVVKDYPILAEAVKRMLKSPSQFELLPPFKIDKKVREFLFSVRNFDHENKMARDSFLGANLAMGFSNYESLLKMTKIGKIYQIKLHIENHYAEADIRFSQIAARYGLGERTAMRWFKAIYGISMRTFKTNLKITNAKLLITENKIPASRATEMVGYLNPTSFYRTARKIEAKLKSN